MTAEHDEGGGYDLVYPFVVCQSNGGQYEDQSFVEGVKMGVATAALERGDVEHVVYANPASVAQYDLLAMHHGYRMTAEPWDEHPDEHVLVTLTRGGAA